MKLNITLFSNINYNQADYEAEYNEIGRNESQTIDDFIAECLSLDYNDFFENLRCSSNNLCECVVVGSLGLWNGRVDVCRKFVSLESAIKACCFNMDFITISQVNGHITVKSQHHDGTNIFNIYLLNEKGQSTYGNLGNKCYHKAIKGYVF